MLRMYEYRKLLYIKENEVNFLRLRVRYSGVIRCQSAATIPIADIEMDIYRHVEGSDSEQTGNNVVFQIAPYPDKNITQFAIYNCDFDYCGNYPEDIQADKLVVVSTSYRERRSIWDTPSLLEVCYFETSYTNFKSFLAYVL